MKTPHSFKVKVRNDNGDVRYLALTGTVWHLVRNSKDAESFDSKAAAFCQWNQTWSEMPSFQGRWFGEVVEGI